MPQGWYAAAVMVDCDACAMHLVHVDADGSCREACLSWSSDYRQPLHLDPEGPARHVVWLPIPEGTALAWLGAYGMREEL